jgi:hypothetical protein
MEWLLLARAVRRRRGARATTAAETRGGCSGLGRRGLLQRGSALRLAARPLGRGGSNDCRRAAAVAAVDKRAFLRRGPAAPRPGAKPRGRGCLLFGLAAVLLLLATAVIATAAHAPVPVVHARALRQGPRARAAPPHARARRGAPAEAVCARWRGRCLRAGLDRIS